VAAEQAAVRERLTVAAAQDAESERAAAQGAGGKRGNGWRRHLLPPKKHVRTGHFPSHHEHGHPPIPPAPLLPPSRCKGSRACTRTHTHTAMHTYAHTHTHTATHTQTHTHAHTHPRAHTEPHAHTYPPTHTPTHTHAHTHTHTHMPLLPHPIAPWGRRHPAPGPRAAGGGPPPAAGGGAARGSPNGGFIYGWKSEIEILSFNLGYFLTGY